MSAGLDLSHLERGSRGEKDRRLRRPAPLVLAGLAAFAQGAVVLRCRAHPTPTSEGVYSRIAVSRGLERGQPLSREGVSFSLRVDAADPETREVFIAESDFRRFEGRYLTHDLPSGTPLSSALTSETPVLPLDVEGIPPGRVLFPLSVKLGALARLLSPGQRVDVLAHMVLPEVGAVTETLLEAVPVVGIGESEDVDGRVRGDVVSFHLRPEEMKLLVHAQKFSEFHLALRNPKEVAATGREAAMTLNRFLANPRIQHALASDVFRIRAGDAPAPMKEDSVPHAPSPLTNAR